VSRWKGRWPWRKSPCEGQTIAETMYVRRLQPEASFLGQAAQMAMVMARSTRKPGEVQSLSHVERSYGDTLLILTIEVREQPITQPMTSPHGGRRGWLSLLSSAVTRSTENARRALKDGAIWLSK